MCTGFMRKRAGKERFANTTQTSVNTGQTFPACLKLSVNPSLQVGVAVFFCPLRYVVAETVCCVCVCVCVGGGNPLPFTYTASEYSTIRVKSTNLCHPLSHFTQMASRGPSQRVCVGRRGGGGRKSAKCQGESSKVCWRAGGEDKKMQASASAPSI